MASDLGLSYICQFLILEDAKNSSHGDPGVWTLLCHSGAVSHEVFKVALFSIILSCYWEDPQLFLIRLSGSAPYLLLGT